MKAPERTPGTGKAGAFTLIEVTIALGLVAIALVGLLGMLPQGMASLKRATDIAVETRIHQQIVSEMAVTDWHQLNEYNQTLRIYDDQGIELDPEKHMTDAIYVARINVPDERDPLPTRFGENNQRGTDYISFDSSEPDDEDRLQLVIVEITSAPNLANVNFLWNVDKPEDFDEPDNYRHIHTYQATVTRMVDLASSKSAGSGGSN